MKKLIFIYGPNGVGKSTLCTELNKKIANSAWLEAEWCRMTNPFVFTPAIIEMVERNITSVLRNYLQCPEIDYVIFNYGFHGPRRQIFENVLQNLSDINYELIPITVTCSEEENVKRMIKNGRDEERIKRALKVRNIYDGVPNPVIDTTYLTIEDTVDKVLEVAGGLISVRKHSYRNR